jgi:putative restriction endonuclease
MASPSLDLDWQLRLAAFDALRRLTEPKGGVISREEMTKGFEFEGNRIPFAIRARGIWKPARHGAGGAALSITTASIRRGVTPRYDDQIGSDDDWFEYRYQGSDPKSADNRAVRRSFELRRPLIYFYGVGPILYEAVVPVYVVGDEPANLTFKIAADASSVGDPRLMVGGAEAPLKAYTTALVKRRLHQHRFRELVVSAYGERCTICQIHHSILLDAAHILEDHDKRGLPEVPNGLALCKIHYSAYDANIMGIDPDRKIHIRGEILAELDGPMLKYGLQKMHGERIQVPGCPELRPKAEYLEERFERFRAA